MNKYTSYIIILFIVFLITSCNNRKIKETNNTIIDTITMNQVSKKNNIETIDSTINISNFTTSKYSGINLSTLLAKQILYNHFKNKGYLISDYLPNELSKSDYQKTCVEFDTIFFLNLNNDKFSDAIVDYWLTPPNASGHCWQPHKAIIIDTDKGYKITNEEFIPTNYCIDSIVTINNRTMIIGYDYDCGSGEVLKYFRLTINK